MFNFTGFALNGRLLPAPNIQVISTPLVANTLKATSRITLQLPLTSQSISEVLAAFASPQSTNLAVQTPSTSLWLTNIPVIAYAPMGKFYGAVLGGGPLGTIPVGTSTIYFTAKVVNLYLTVLSDVFIPTTLTSTMLY